MSPGDGEPLPSVSLRETVLVASATGFPCSARRRPPGDCSSTRTRPGPSIFPRCASPLAPGSRYTGDRAGIDEDGYWWFVGRGDDVIKSSDFRIGPFEVESALMEHPAVAETAVVGVPDEKRYQLVKAFVILGKGEEPSRELACDLFRHTISILAKFKIPRIIEFVPEVPKTLSGKIRRVELRQREIDRKRNKEKAPNPEFFYWEFPELGSRRC